jgi:hypothetical protein
MAIQVFEGWIDDVSADTMYVRLVDITVLDIKKPNEGYREQLCAEIGTKFVSAHDKKYIIEGAVFNILIRPKEDGKEEKAILRFKKCKPITEEQLKEIEIKAKELGELLGVDDE